MANQNEQKLHNVPGRFYVDLSCVDCDQCRETAPLFFRRNEEIAQSIVYRQPASAEEIELALQAMNCCPTDSIGNDGQD